MRPEQTDPTPRTRGIDIQPFPKADGLAFVARARAHRAALHYLLTADVTAARRLMAMSPKTLSLTGFIAVSVARAAAEAPIVHSYRDWRGRLVTHRRVDVMIPIETQTGDGPRLIPHVVRNVDTRDVAEVSSELLSVKDAPAVGILGSLHRFTGVPGLARAAATVADRSTRSRQRIGTVLLDTTGMRDVGEVFGVAAPTPMPLHVMVGSIRPDQHQMSHVIEQREVLNLTLTFDRGIVSTAQAARFTSRLCFAIEHAEALQSHVAPSVPDNPFLEREASASSDSV